jgi:hypothetical protein
MRRSGSSIVDNGVNDIRITGTGVCVCVLHTFIYSYPNPINAHLFRWHPIGELPTDFQYNHRYCFNSCLLGWFSVTNG